MKLQKDKLEAQRKTAAEDKLDPINMLGEVMMR